MDKFASQNEEDIVIDEKFMRDFSEMNPQQQYIIRWVVTHFEEWKAICGVSEMDWELCENLLLELERAGLEEFRSIVAYRQMLLEKEGLGPHKDEP